MSKLLVLILMIIFSQYSYAEATLHKLKTDQRAKIVAFHPQQIYLLKTHYLISTDIIFGADEIVNPGDVHLGDASAWDIEAHKNHLYLKAKKLDAGGNLNVATNKYTYHFVLNVSDAPIDSNEQTLFLQFTYPTHGANERHLALQLVEVPKHICEDKSQYNLQYSFTGDKEQAPIRACDDGLFTYFKFRSHIDLPAVFMVLPDRREEVVNYRIEKGYYVVERIAKAFTLRNGDTVTSIYNDKYIGDWQRIH